MLCPRAGHLHRTPFNASFSPYVPPSVSTKSALPICNAPHVGPLPYNSATATQLVPSRSSPPSSWLLQLTLKNADLLACPTQLEIPERPSRAQHQPITSCSLPSPQAHFLPVLATLNSLAPTLCWAFSRHWRTVGVKRDKGSMPWLPVQRPTSTLQDHVFL